MAAMIGLVLTASAGVARAQAALDEDETKPSASSAVSKDDEVRFGIGIRQREVWVPRSIIELFVDHAAGGSQQYSFLGLELFRRKGDFEVQFGLEYDKIFVDPGIWVEKGKEPTLAGGGADDVRFDNFGWITAEVTFINHSPINKYFAIRYGGGAGIGILKGHVRRTDAWCDNANSSAVGTPANPCHDAPEMGNSDKPYDLPPVFPVLNAIVGVQIRPTDNIIVNVEGGIRTLPFFGASVAYIF